MSHPFPAHWIDALCEVMHEAYEDEARRVGWVTQEASQVDWSDLPDGNKAAMRAGVRAMVGALFRGDADWPSRRDAPSAPHRTARSDADGTALPDRPGGSGGAQNATQTDDTDEETM